ncbi:MAG TPA: hypothetical protein VNG51_29600 [Ktedonobacteraceae bacterium]|nr:hypothetical protein [Ktedonobacteraceae bacterium]
MKKQKIYIFPRWVSNVLLFVLALLLVACAGATVSQQSGATPTYPSDPVQNPTPIEQTAVAGAVEVHVTLVEFKIYSTVTTFRVGVPYHFVVSNRGTMVHEFMITLDHPDGTSYPSSEQDAHAIIHIEVVNPGTTINLNYTFLPSSGSRYEMACQMRGHYAAGMHLALIVMH